MANNKKSILSLSKNLQDSMDKIYRNTYITTPTNLKDLNDIKSNLDTSIDNITTKTKDAIGVSNISRIYSRIDDRDSNKESKTKFEEILSDKGVSDNIITAFAENKTYRDYDLDIDLICAYMPKIESALELKKDHILCADNFSTDFITAVNKSNINNKTLFNDRIKEIKKKYNILESCEEWYMGASKYGERFIYHIPYNKAFNALSSLKENADVINETTFISINESSQKLNGVKNVDNTPSDECIPNIKVILDKRSIIESAVYSHDKIISIHNENSKIVPDKLEFEGVMDGIMDTSKLASKKNNIDIDVVGCVVKDLDREKTIPIYIENVCLGYYFIECDINEIPSTNKSYMGILTNKTVNLDKPKEDMKKNIINTICGKMSQYIDKNFINNNQDLKKELYTILKAHDVFNISKQSDMTMRVTFIPPEDITHIYFKKDKNHRGVSDIHKAIVPAKIWIAIMTTNMIGLITRSHDKRVYYVKNHIESNISKVLMNTMNELKKSNYGSREIMNIKNFLNVQGQYNDLLIPMGSSGEAPVNIETMQGQDIDMKQDFLDKLEETTIESVDVPYEFVTSSNQIDFAARLTMHSGKFYKMALKRQSIYKNPISRILTTIYNAEYNENDEIEVEFPSPSYLDTLNAKEIASSVNDMADIIIDMETEHLQDDVKRSIFKKNLKREMIKSYIDLDMIDRVLRESELEAKTIVQDE
ncbi:MAG: hypothetical protein ACRCXT_18250 [Paraclostridium sp.]